MGVPDVPPPSGTEIRWINKKNLNLLFGDRIDMKVLRENKVLVLSSLLAIGVAWIAGCAGMAEPLPYSIRGPGDVIREYEGRNVEYGASLGD